MRKNLRSKILLCILAGGVLAANTALADAPDKDVRETGDAAYANAELIYNDTYSKNSGYLKAEAEGTGNVAAITVYSINSDLTLENVEVTAIATSTNSKPQNVIAVYATEGSEVEINGGKITAVANDGDEYAVYSWDSNVNINSDNIVINGDIYSYGDGTININLNTQNAILNGAVRNGADEINLTLVNGATWNTKGHFGSKITNLTMNNGIIKPVYIGSMTVENYSGIGDIMLDLGDDTSGNGSIDVDGGRTDIENAASGSIINLIVTNNNLADTANDAKALENLNELAKEIRYDAADGNLTGKVTIKEGLIMPEVSGDLLFEETGKHEGYVANIASKKTSATMDSMQHLAKLPLQHGGRRTAP